MTVQKYLEAMKNIQNNLLDFINNDEAEENYQNLISIFTDQKIQEDGDQLKSVLYLICKVSENIYRPPKFFSKIERILLFLKESIKRSFSNSEIFDIFKKQKRILLFLFKEKILIMNQHIYSQIISNKLMRKNYHKYLLPEILPFLNKKTSISKEIPEKFEERRIIGENHNYICEIIRKDLIGDFIIYVEKESIVLDSLIETSIYETNPFLLNKKVSLIEYCAFFGSIQIFNYLYKNGVTLESSLILFAIHGANPEIINIFEQEKIKIDEELYKKCLKESIKCHHNSIADYISANFLENSNEKIYLIFNTCLSSYNFYFIQKEKINKYVFYDLCANDYVYLVNYFLNTCKIEINYRIVLMKLLF